MTKDALYELHRGQGLSHRASRLLVEHGINTAGKLVRLGSDTMRLWKGCGEKTIEEINDYAERMEREITDRLSDFVDTAMALQKTPKEALKELRQLEELIG
jgi:hypothetical protein